MRGEPEGVELAVAGANIFCELLKTCDPAFVLLVCGDLGCSAQFEINTSDNNVKYHF
jgi:hypothetical protein